jgi:glycosyltransferase involved in cell wall biosynthesis
MHAFVVIPCLNEEKNLFSTCSSLGFGNGVDNLLPATLVIVNNGSTDGTQNVAEAVARNSHIDSVIIVDESVRGFVPARVRGVQESYARAKTMGLAPDECLIIQADADTIYSREYIESFLRHSQILGPGVLLESVCLSDNKDPMVAKLTDLLNDFDGKFFADQLIQSDCVVDDKSVGYRYSDWLAVGGMQRDFIGTKELIYCGTTRLWMRMLANGFTRRSVEEASCSHSLRKLEEGPDIYVATAGWPRSSSWKERWRFKHPDYSLEQVLDPSSRVFRESFESRMSYLRAMFSHLPQVFERAATGNDSILPAEIIQEAFLRESINLLD